MDTLNVSMPVISNRNIKVHWDFILLNNDYMPAIDTANVFYLNDKNQMDYIYQFPFAKNTHLEMAEVIKPVKELSIISHHFARYDSLGL